MIIRAAPILLLDLFGQLLDLRLQVPDDFLLALIRGLLLQGLLHLVHLLFAHFVALHVPLVHLVKHRLGDLLRVVVVDELEELPTDHLQPAHAVQACPIVVEIILEN